MNNATFGYHRAIAPMLYVLAALMTIEMVVVHALLAIWWPRIAVVLSAVSLLSLAWLVRLIRSFRHMPVLIGDGRLVMRVGTLRRIDVPLAAISGLRADGWSAADMKARGVANLAMIAFPNVVVDLNAPIMTPRGARTAIAHRLDDPVAFAAALDALRPRA